METEALVLEHLDLVDRCARRFRGWGEPHDDLVQAGRIGLLHAARRYDAARGVPFAAYAVPTVLGEIRHHLRDRSHVLRGPRGAPRPVVQELEEGGAADPAPGADHERVELRMLLLPQLELLPEAERAVVTLHFLEGHTQDAVAEQLGVSQAQASRIQARALARLRRRLGAGTRSAA
jgi:RNA polymerase sigma-B factor